jgi:hypothetical protein
VGVDRHVGVGVAEHRVAEGVVEVLVGVHDGEHLAVAQATDVLEQRAGVGLRGMGVDHQHAAAAGDHPDVDVEELVAGHPAAVGHLHEAGVVRNRGSCGGRHGPSLGPWIPPSAGEASSIGTRNT